MVSEIQSAGERGRQALVVGERRYALKVQTPMIFTVVSLDAIDSDDYGAMPANDLPRHVFKARLEIDNCTWMASIYKLIAS